MMHSHTVSAFLLVAIVSVASAATLFRTQSSSAGGSSINGINTSYSSNGLGTRGGFGNRGSGGTAYQSTTSFNGRPTSFNSFTSGTGVNTFGSGYGSLGTRGGFNNGYNSGYRPFRFPQIQPAVPFVPYIGQNNYNQGYSGYNSGLGTRFGGGSSFSGASSSSSGLGFDMSGYFNALADNINRNFAAGLARG